MIWLSALLVFQTPAGTITRTEFGVPHVQAPSALRAFHLAGVAVAEDRLWQMELTRNIARGKLAALIGPSGLASDREFHRTSYSDAELMDQFGRLPVKIQRYFEAYAEGVNQTIHARIAAGTLPPEYAQNQAKPAPWTVLDSLAIGVRLGRQFGTGGEGELRNLALLNYLKGQRLNGKELDVLDDLAWFNRPEAATTIPIGQDPLAGKSLKFWFPKRADTEAHLKALPPTNLMELIPAIRLARGEETRTVAQATNTLYKTGSYAILVGGASSKTGNPLLLGGPQMGHTIPSVVHEMAISCPEFGVTGMDLPGLPGVLIGMSRNLAWTFTSGVADVSDIVVSRKSGADAYLYGGKARPLERITRTIQVRGGEPVTVEQVRTQFGPVLLDSKTGDAVYSVRASYWGAEMRSIPFVMGLYTAKTAKEGLTLSRLHPVSFNFFVAAKDGSTGYRFCGDVPVRAPGQDPRLPILGEPENEWRGMVPADQMPYSLNPTGGVLINWNNKPASWWPNFDTPVWGRHFRVAALEAALPKGKLGPRDMERAIWAIARRENSEMALMPWMKRALGAPEPEPGAEALRQSLLGYDGWEVEGSVAASAYRGLVDEIRRELFMSHVGSFLTPATFNTVLQLDLVERALEGTTAFDYLARRTPEAVVKAAFARLAKRGAEPFAPGGIRVAEGPLVPYGNRGTYIQLVELGPRPSGRNVLPPGVTEAGAHRADQVPLARNWGLKPMVQP